MFSRVNYEFFKNTYFEEHMRTTASETCSFTWTASFDNLASGSNWYLCFSFSITIYSFVCQFSLHYCWYCYNQKQLSGGVLQNSYSYKFRKIHMKTPALKSPFKWSCRSTEFKIIKKEIPAHMFSCEFCEIFITSLLKSRLLLHKHSFCLLSHYKLLPFQKRCHNSPATYFLDLICSLQQEWAQYFKPLGKS